MNPQQIIPFILCACYTLGIVTGCSTTQDRLGSDSYEIRNSQLAAKLTSDAVELLHEDPTVAERLLREALLADLYHGPAHNNLGVLYLSRGELYQAAEEFDWARRLMPGHPDPRINLGIVLERGGKVHEALEAYASALEVYPDHLPAIQAIVRCQLRHDETDDRTHKFLRVVSFRGTREWKEWARGQLSSDVRQDQ